MIPPAFSISLAIGPLVLLSYGCDPLSIPKALPRLSENDRTLALMLGQGTLISEASATIADEGEGGGMVGVDNETTYSTLF